MNATSAITSKTIGTGPTCIATSVALAATMPITAATTCVSFARHPLAALLGLSRK
jgi:hypothetical protein